ncbi:MAG TPA: tripartite tricarboxylate transporter substrate binding protein [Burkholderiales bacterium]|nr:tripartite tricarboxylate transporter substrate binding protein [Burkholderiales bacterium]
MKAGTAVLGIVFAAAASAQTQYPSKPVRIVAPFAPGSTIDIIGRLIAPRLSEALAHPVIVENRPGAGGAVGLDAVAKSAPDGHVTAIGALGPLAMNPALYPRSPFDPVRDFAPVTLLATGPVVIAVHPSVPARNVKELIDLAKKNPGKLNFGSPGVGTSPHLTGELVKMLTRTDIVHVPYKGNAEALTDLVSGRVSIVYTGVPPVVPLAKAGRVRLIATTGKSRIAGLPEVPTIAEAGLADAQVLIWYGVVAPAATPREIVARLNREIVRVMQAPDIKERFIQQGIDPETSTPDAFGKLIADEYARWTKVIRAAGIKLE